VFEHDNAVVLVLDYVDGISLADLLARQGAGSRRAFSDDAALHIGLSICDALAHAHAVLDEQRAHAAIVHRAVSPSNILIGRDGTVKLDGFGFAKISGGVATRRADDSTWTPAYLAPEQTTAEPPTSKIDVYAAGLILWELLTGRSATTLPHDPFAIEATMKAVAERSPDPLATLRPDIPEELAAAVDAALVSAPERRTITCAEMARTIRRVYRVASGRIELCEATSLVATAPSCSLPAFPPMVGVLQPGSPPPRSRADIVREAKSVELLPNERGTAAPDPEQSPRSDESSGVLSWSSLVGRLNAPTPWRRSTCLVAWVLLLLGLGGLVTKLSIETPPAEAPAAAEAFLETEALAVSPEEPATNALGGSSALDAPSTQQMMRRGLGYLTVHSSAARANVYINLKSYGGLEEKLIVPCGRRFVSIGIPARSPSKTVWLAPGRTMLIPCAGTYEATMNPHALR
jgi:serine/threonine protein kinase